MIEPVTADGMGLGFAMMKARYEFLGYDTGQSETDITGEIIRNYARRNGVFVSTLIGPARTRTIAHHRQNVMAELREKTKMSMPEIGRVFNRDHTTVLHALRAVKARAAT